MGGGRCLWEALYSDGLGVKGSLVPGSAVLDPFLGNWSEGEGDSHLQAGHLCAWRESSEPGSLCSWLARRLQLGPGVLMKARRQQGGHGDGP